MARASRLTATAADGKRRLSRRKAIRSGGSTLATALAGLTTATVAAASAEDLIEAIPEAVEIDYPAERVSAYQPRLQVGHLSIKTDAVYAARFRRADRDTDVYAYWTTYVGQEGYTRWDSHTGDREPFLVFVDATGAVQEVWYSSWHWLAAGNYQPPTRDATHAVAHVARPHHHYVLNPDVPTAGAYPDLLPLVDFDDNGRVSRDSAAVNWYQNGWTAIDKQVLWDPWRIRGERDWWKKDAVFGLSSDTAANARRGLWLAELLPWGPEVKTDL